MPTSGPNHTPVKPERIAATAAVSLEEQLVVPALFQREGIEPFRGAKDDTINVTVEGVLPYRTYGWRNNRSTSLTYDDYTERKFALTFGDDIYQGVYLTDEQYEMDFDGWTKLVSKQTEAVGRGLEFEAVDEMVNAPYNVTLGGAVSGRDLRATLIKARQTLNQMRCPADGRVMVVGTDWEAALLGDDKLNLAQNVGEAEAVSALHDATIGRRYGFQIVVSQELAPDAAVAMHPSAFIFLTAAPSVPQSAAFGASASHNGIALRWVRSYDLDKLRDRSVVNAYKGFQVVKDPLIGVDTANPRQAYVSDNEHFVRAIKLDLDATADVTPDGDTAAESEFIAITGIGTDLTP